MKRIRFSSFVVPAIVASGIFWMACTPPPPPGPTPEEMARIIGDVLGTTVTAESYDPERIESEDMRAMFTFLGDRGYEVDIPTLHRRFPDVGWQSFATWAAEALRR